MDILKSMVGKKASDVKKDADTFGDEHPIVACLIVGMAAVIFAQHVELRCYQIVMQR